MFYRALYGIYIIGFPAYEKHPNLSYWESLFHSGFLEPYGRIVVASILFYIAYTISKSYFIEKFLASKLTYGTITSINFSNTRINNKPLIDIEVEYMGLQGVFQDQPSDFAFEFSKGSLIPIKYQEGKPEIAVIPENAIEIAKKHPGHT